MTVNMSYCRFENTLAALRECCESEDMVDPGQLNKYETKARLKLIQLCREIAVDFAEDEEDGDGE